MEHHHSHHHESHKNILLAFLLNISFSLFEAIGGFLMNSYAIMSDALHDLGDAITIGVSYFLEKKSHRHADSRYTFGYARYSTLGALITTIVILVGSGAVIAGAIGRILSPKEVNHDGVIIFAIIGVIVNGIAVFVTREKNSANQRAVSLHMLEDVLGWVAVLAGSIIIKFTGWDVMDPIMSIGIAVFLIINAYQNLKPIADVFLDRAPSNLDIYALSTCINEVSGIEDVHHLHVWLSDEEKICATAHLVVTGDVATVKKDARKVFAKFNIRHVVLETEIKGEECKDRKH